MAVVVASGLEMARQRRPTGPAFAVDAEWKKEVRAAMKRQGISNADLASKIGVTPSALTVLFRPETKQTRLKPAIHRELGLVAPTVEPAIAKDEAFTRLVRAWAVLSDEERAARSDGNCVEKTLSHRGHIHSGLAENLRSRT